MSISAIHRPRSLQLAKAIRKERTNRGWTAEEISSKLAVQTGVPYRKDVISKIESGERKLSYMEVEDFCSVFRCRVDHFNTRPKLRVKSKKDILAALKTGCRIVRVQAANKKERFWLKHKNGKRERVSQKRCRALKNKGVIKVLTVEGQETLYVLA